MSTFLPASAGRFVNLLLFAFVGGGFVLTGCSSSCESACDRQYSDCVAKAPPGASRSDCSVRQQQCVVQCRTPAPAPT